MSFFPERTEIPALLRLPAAPDSAGRARSFVRTILGDHPRIDDAVLSVSELVTNAVRHGPGEDMLAVIVDRREAAIRVSVQQRPGSVRIDRSGRTEVGGLGLTIVERVSDGWGVDDERGVWFEIAEASTFSNGGPASDPR